MEEFLNFFQVAENISTSGQPTREQIAEIAGRGYTAVLNLAMHNSENAIPEEGSIVASLGMSYCHIPVPFEKPTTAHLKRFFGVMEVLDGEKVWVHCAINARVSAFMHQYLTLKKGLGSEEATSPLLAQWRPRMDDAWRAIMDLELREVEL